MLLLLLLLVVWLVGLGNTEVTAQPQVYNSFRPLSAFYELQKQEIANLTLQLQTALTYSTWEEEDDYSEKEEDIDGLGKFSLRPCSTANCKVKYTNRKLDYTLPCSTASGNIPDKFELPMLFPGNYDLCRISFGKVAHFCTISGMLVYPLVHKNKLVDAVPIGKLEIGKCVASACSASRLKRKFRHGMRKTLLHLAPKLGIVPMGVIDALLEQTLTVHCERDSQRENGKETEIMGTTMFYLLLVILTVVTLLCTTYHTCYPRASSKLLLFFSLKHNIFQLMQPMRNAGGELDFLNGVRILSIIWVIYGHTVLLSVGVGLDVPISNPSAMDEEVFQPIIALIRGGEYAVDTFFFMSGLLAMERVLSAPWKRLTIKSYMGFVLMRALRLLPVYMFVMFFYVKAMPFWGSGPYWYRNANRQHMEHECRNFWTNILFINNLVPFGSGIMGCMGWTWYLANDFQYLLLVPFLAALFHYTNARMQDSKYRQYCAFAPCALLVVGQILITAYLSWHYDIQGAFDSKYNKHIYVKPWCRVAPYAIGCLYAMLRWERKHHGLELSAAPHMVRALLGVGLALVFTVPAVLFDDMACRAEDNACTSYYAWLMYGSFGHGNWNQAGKIAFTSLSYAAWGVGLVCLSEFATSEQGKQTFVVRILSSPGLTPLARLTYVVYLIHMIVMVMFYAQRTGPMVVSKGRQFMDTVGFVVVAFAISFVLHVIVERPINSALVWTLGLNKKAQLTQAQSHGMSEDLAGHAAATEPLLTTQRHVEAA